MDIKDRIHRMMERPGFQAREDQETLADAIGEIKRLRSELGNAANGVMALAPSDGVGDATPFLQLAVNINAAAMMTAQMEPASATPS